MFWMHALTRLTSTSASAAILATWRSPFMYGSTYLQQVIAVSSVSWLGRIRLCTLLSHDASQSLTPVFFQRPHLSTLTEDQAYLLRRKIPFTGDDGFVKNWHFVIQNWPWVRIDADHFQMDRCGGSCMPEVALSYHSLNNGIMYLLTLRLHARSELFSCSRIWCRNSGRPAFDVSSDRKQHSVSK